MSVFRWPYPPAPSQGHWGNVTSLIDWCEENYVVSPYIAEWSNTLTNAIFVLVAVYYTYCSLRNSMEYRFVLIGLGFALVGVGSWWFHMTLQYKYQLLDELPMVYATATPAWSLLCEFDWKTKSKRDKSRISRTREVVMGILVAGFATLLTWIYLVFRYPLIFQASYGFLNFVVVGISGTFAYQLTSRSPRVKKNLYMTMAIGVVLFVLGFVLWELDNTLCNVWIHIRRHYLGLPWGLFFEFHAWWHLLTGAGVYYYIVFLAYLRLLNLGVENQYLYIWRWRILPELVKKDSAITTKYSLSFWGPLQSEATRRGKKVKKSAKTAKSQAVGSGAATDDKKKKKKGKKVAKKAVKSDTAATSSAAK